MGTPHTLHNKMHSTDLLVIICRACDYTHTATKRAAQRRYGQYATSYYIEATSRCLNCGGREIEAAIDHDENRRAITPRQSYRPLV